jgi:DNA-binding CsgD family transcriptional regulator/uncharacterized membrane protein
MAVAHTADSLGDMRLKSYAQYFRICYRVLFSSRYEQYFPPGDYKQVVMVFANAQKWAQQNGHTAIAAACKHYIGEVYFKAAQYGPAFEHLLKANVAFQEIGYENVPAISIYLHNLGLNYYQFEEYDKALEAFLAASQHPFFINRTELNTLNSIGLIYARQQNWNKAVTYYRKTIARAKENNDVVWIGIASGNLGNGFLAKEQNDSALFYHNKNYNINVNHDAPEDAAKSALAIATIYIRQQQPDSAWHYILAGQALNKKNNSDPAERLAFNKRLLISILGYHKLKENYKLALICSDSLAAVNNRLQHLLDAKILNRAVVKAEAERYQAELQLLESQKKLSRLRFYVLITLLLSIIFISGWLFIRFRRNKIRQMHLAEKEKHTISFAKRRAEEKLYQAETLLAAYLTSLKEKTAQIDSLDTELQRQKEEKNDSELLTMAAKREKLIYSTIFTDEDWQYFRSLFEQVYPGFIYRLKEKYPDLSPGETRLLILTKLNLSTGEMAQMLGLTILAIRKARYRLRKKFDLDEKSKLDVLIQYI